MLDARSATTRRSHGRARRGAHASAAFLLSSALGIGCGSGDLPPATDLAAQRPSGEASDAEGPAAAEPARGESAPGDMPTTEAAAGELVDPGVAPPSTPPLDDGQAGGEAQLPTEPAESDQLGPAPEEPGQALPPVSDYGARGPFETRTVESTGPGGQFTMFRPEALGENGFLHPPATWGNGITTRPSQYTALLSTIASHGFVVIASNSTTVTARNMTEGLDWLLSQNASPGELQGTLDPQRAVSIGYSLGGGAAVDAGSHPNVVTTVSFHGLTGNSAALRGPLLLFTGTQDDFVSAERFVDPTFNRSTVPTFYTSLTGAGHLQPLGDAGDERAPTIAWLRMWVYGDEGAREFFYGDDCVLCSSPWTDTQTKNWP